MTHVCKRMHNETGRQTVDCFIILQLLTQNQNKESTVMLAACESVVTSGACELHATAGVLT